MTIYRDRGLKVETLTLDDAQEILGVNSRGELAQIGQLLKMSRNAALMASGVTIVDPATAYHRPGRRHRGRYHHPSERLLEGPTIGSGCEIQCGVRIVNSALQENVFVNSFCVITDSHIAKERSSDRSPTSAGLARQRRGRTRRQLRRAEEDGPGPGLEGQPPRVSRRRGHGRERQHRRRHDHLQLRRQKKHRRRSRMARSSAAIRSSSRRSPSAKALTSPPDRRLPRTSLPALSPYRAASKSTKRAGSTGRRN